MANRKRLTAIPCVHCPKGAKRYTTDQLEGHTMDRHFGKYNKKIRCGCGNLFLRKQDKEVHIALHCVLRHDDPFPQDGSEDSKVQGDGDLEMEADEDLDIEADENDEAGEDEDLEMEADEDLDIEADENDEAGEDEDVEDA